MDFDLNMKKIIIIGSSGHAKVIIDTINYSGTYKIIGLIDPFRDIGEKTLAYSILGNNYDLPSLMKKHNVCGLHVAIGDNFTRKKVVNEIRNLIPNVSFYSIIHPRAVIGSDVKIGDGCFVMAGAIINTSSVLESFCMVNTNASLDHDCFMGAFSSLAPGVTIGGNTIIGEYTAVGIGAVVKHKMKIGRNVIVGASALVLNNIPDDVISYGSPSAVIRRRNEEDKYL